MSFIFVSESVYFEIYDEFILAKNKQSGTKLINKCIVK